MNVPMLTLGMRPYLIRALYEWCTDNGFTPYLAVAVDSQVQVPHEYVKDNEIVLNIGFDATSALTLGNEFIEFKARFGGKAREILVPVSHVLAIFARENGQGMPFPLEMPTEVHADADSDRQAGDGRIPVGTAPGSAIQGPGAASDSKIMQLVETLPSVGVPGGPKLQSSDAPDPPKPPTGPRPALKRVK